MEHVTFREGSQIVQSFFSQGLSGAYAMVLAACSIALDPAPALAQQGGKQAVTDHATNEGKASVFELIPVDKRQREAEATNSCVRDFRNDVERAQKILSDESHIVCLLYTSPSPRDRG